MKPRKILEQEFKKEFGEDWETELRDFEHAFGSYFDCSIRAIQQASNDRWVNVNKEKPPNDINLLVKTPSGIMYLTRWRPAYNIFTCQSKGESTFNWQWKLV